MKRTFLLIALLFFFVGASVITQAQETTAMRLLRLWEQFVQWREERISVTDTYRVTGSGVAYSPIQDTRMTDLIYRTMGVGAVGQRRTYRPKEIQLITLNSHVSLPLNENFLSLDDIYTSAFITLDWAYLRRLKKLPLAIGASTSVTAHTRVLSSLGNSGLNGDGIISVNATTHWEYKFLLLDRPAEFHVQLSTPLFSRLMRYPEYNISGFEQMWVMPWDMPRIRINLGISRLLTHSEENRLTLDYWYDFYAHRGDHDRITVGSHCITLGYALKKR